MILSNQIECIKCGDQPYSAHRHDFKPCKCKAVAVDGGMIYLRRVGEDKYIKEMSISMDDNLYHACERQIKTQMELGKNSLGILCGIVRTLRDGGYEIRKIPNG